MKKDNIKEIGIDSQERLYVVPERENFLYKWRSATEVHWDEKGHFLYSPKPREWSYFDWYAQIVGAIKSEYGCNLFLTGETKWVNISDDLKNEISKYILQ